MPCVYVLYSQIVNRFYIGSSRNNDAQKRLKSHNLGKTKSTKTGRPWIVVYKEEFPTYKEARQKENFLKSGVGRKWINDNFKSYKELR